MVDSTDRFLFDYLSDNEISDPSINTEIFIDAVKKIDSLVSKNNVDVSIERKARSYLACYKLLMSKDSN